MAEWDGNMTQEQFMLRDQCILLDGQDTVVGCDNKYETHIFCPERPRGKLHRAFSVFLFDSDNKLLLQQRAASKITFPNVCCLLYTSDAADEEDSVDLGGRRIIKKKKKIRDGVKMVMMIRTVEDK
eukprot:TRINITY_DN13517_c0_g1_i4.p2 TRINITY_DN13517_c0_g1~~TRINITY_DN13517_c0_g1_i4.p2  ORF type:complete len:126 (+),score=45.81 TRINITY_DN13517_c0_g1_i4:201-578(+)